MKQPDETPENDNTIAAQPEEVAQTIMGILPVGAVTAASTSGIAGTNNPGSIPGGAALLPILTSSDTADTEDGHIAQLLESTLADDPTLSPNIASTISVAVQNRMVHLTGKVATEHDRQAVISAAARLPGVRAVDDRMTIGAPL
jgi:osmotically-inducible protein OsmY